MKKTLKFLVCTIQILASGLCLVLVAIPVIITIASALRLIDRTSNQAFWLTGFFSIFFGIFAFGLFAAGEYAFVSLVRTPTLLKIFSDDSLHRLQRGEEILTKLTNMAAPMFLLNFVLALIMWNGFGHELAGTWMFTAGQVPMFVPVVAMIPILIQRNVWKMVLKKTGKWRTGPYDD